MGAEKLGVYILDHDEKSFYVNEEGEAQKIEYSSNTQKAIISDTGEIKKEITDRDHQNYVNFTFSFDELNFEDEADAVEKLESLAEDIAGIEISEAHKTVNSNKQLRLDNIDEDFDDLDIDNQEKIITEYLKKQYKDTKDVGTPEVLDWERTQNAYGHEIVNIKIKRRYGVFDNLEDSIISIHTKSSDEIEGRANYKVKPHLHLVFPKDNFFGRDYIYLRKELNKKFKEHELTANNSVEIKEERSKEYNILKDRLSNFSWVVAKHEDPTYARKQLSNYRGENCITIDNVEEKVNEFLELNGSYDFARKLQINLKEKLNIDIELEAPKSYKEADSLIREGNYEGIIENVKENALNGERISERYKEFAKDILENVDEIDIKEVATARAIKEIVKNRGYTFDQNWNKVIDTEKINQIADRGLEKVEQFSEELEIDLNNYDIEITIEDIDDSFSKSNLDTIEKLEGLDNLELTKETEKAVLVANEVWLPKSVFESDPVKTNINLQIEERVKDFEYIRLDELEKDLKIIDKDVEDISDYNKEEIIYFSSLNHILDNLDHRKIENNNQLSNRIKRIINKDKLEFERIEEPMVNDNGVVKDSLIDYMNKRVNVKQRIDNKEYIYKEQLERDLDGFDLDEVSNKSDYQILWEGKESYALNNIDYKEVNNRVEFEDEINDLGLDIDNDFFVSQVYSKIEKRQEIKDKIDNNEYIREVDLRADLKEADVKESDLNDLFDKSKGQVVFEGVENHIRGNLILRDYDQRKVNTTRYKITHKKDISDLKIELELEDIKGWYFEAEPETIEKLRNLDNLNLTRQTDEAILIENGVWLPKSVLHEAVVDELNDITEIREEINLSANIDSKEFFEDIKGQIIDINKEDNLDMSANWVNQIALKIYSERNLNWSEVNSVDDLVNQIESFALDLNLDIDRFANSLYWDRFNEVKEVISENLDLDIINPLNAFEEIKGQIKEIDKLKGLDISANWINQLAGSIYKQEGFKEKAKNAWKEKLINKNNKNSLVNKLEELRKAKEKIAKKLNQVLGDEESEIEKEFKRINQAINGLFNLGAGLEADIRAWQQIKEKKADLNSLNLDLDKIENNLNVAEQRLEKIKNATDNLDWSEINKVEDIKEKMIELENKDYIESISKTLFWDKYKETRNHVEDTLDEDKINKIKPFESIRGQIDKMDLGLSDDMKDMITGSICKEHDYIEQSQKMKDKIKTFQAMIRGLEEITEETIFDNKDHLDKLFKEFRAKSLGLFKTLVNLPVNWERYKKEVEYKQKIKETQKWVRNEINYMKWESHRKELIKNTVEDSPYEIKELSKDRESGEYTLSLDNGRDITFNEDIIPKRFKTTSQKLKDKLNRLEKREKTKPKSKPEQQQELEAKKAEPTLEEQPQEQDLTLEELKVKRKTSKSKMNDMFSKIRKVNSNINSLKTKQNENNIINKKIEIVDKVEPKGFFGRLASEINKNSYIYKLNKLNKLNEKKISNKEELKNLKEGLKDEISDLSKEDLKVELQKFKFDNKQKGVLKEVLESTLNENVETKLEKLKELRGELKEKQNKIVKQYNEYNSQVKQMERQVKQQQGRNR